jgi:hypothetical protein
MWQRTLPVVNSQSVPDAFHEDVRTTMQLYAQSDQESRLEAQGKFLELLLGDKAHLLTETVQ